MLKDLIEMLNPKGGRGLFETIIAVVLIVGIVYLNANEVQIDKLLEGIAWLFFGYMWGNRPHNRREDDNDKD